MKANHLKSGEASSFQGYSRSIPHCAVTITVTSRETALSSSRTTGPGWGPNGRSWGWRYVPPNSRGRSGRRGQLQDAESPSSQTLFPPRPSHRVDTEPCKLQPASGQGELATGRARDKDTQDHGALCSSHLHSWGDKQTFSETL